VFETAQAALFVETAQVDEQFGNGAVGQPSRLFRADTGGYFSGEINRVSRLRKKSGGHGNVCFPSYNNEFYKVNISTGFSADSYVNYILLRETYIGCNAILF
jgi:hypothetical protein